MAGKKMDIARKIKNRRVELQFTQSELAALAGLDRAHVSRLESGAITRMTPLTVHRIAEALQVPPSFFAEEVNLLNIELADVDEVLLAKFLKYTRQHKLDYNSAFEKLLRELLP